MKRVLILIARFEFGGIPIQAYLWAKYLKERGFEPIILAQFVFDKRFVNFLEKDDLKYGFIFSKDLNGSIVNSISYLIKLTKSINEYFPDCIFSFNKHLSYNVNLIWRFTSAKKSFFMERGDGCEKYASQFDRFMKLFSQFNSSKLIFNSDSAIKNSFFPYKSIVIKNTYRNFNPQGTEEKFKNKITLLHVANIGFPKNYELLIKGWELLNSKYSNLELLIIGSDIKSSNHNLLDKFKRLNINYLGRVENTWDIICKSDICLLSSFSEGCPNVLLEYMSAGKLIVASDIPSIREVLDPLNHQFLFDNLSPNDFLEKISNILLISDFVKLELISKNKVKLKRDYSERNMFSVLNLLNE